MPKPKLYVHVGKAGHFLRWELEHFAHHFDLVAAPAPDALLLSFGPDVLDEASRMPALKRFAVLFPGFSFNPVRDAALRDRQRATIARDFDRVFINPGPLQIAYAGIDNITLYPFSIDVRLARLRNYRTTLDSLLHVSHDNPQKDWRRSEAIMHKSRLRYEVYPPRNQAVLTNHVRRAQRLNAVRSRVGLKPVAHLPVGYVDHRSTIAKYQDYDGFVHVARDARHPEFIDGMYTASLIEAGATGAILFWHDTWGLGNILETVIELPLDTSAAAEMILDVRSSLDVAAHSRLTREEILDTFSPDASVRLRAETMLSFL